VDWSEFKTTDLNVYADQVTGYINKLVEECIPTKNVRSCPNSKPWMNPIIRIKLREQSTAFTSGGSHLYKKAKYDLRKAITDYKGSPGGVINTNPPNQMS